MKPFFPVLNIRLILFLFISGLAFSSQVIAAACSTSVSPYAVDCDGSGVSWASGNLTINTGVTLSDTGSFTFKAPSASFINNGTITDATVGGVAVTPGNGGIAITLSNITNNGSITGGQSAIQTFNSVTINTITNNGTLNAENGLYFQSLNVIGNIVNTGTVTGTAPAGSARGIFNDGAVGTISNSGTLQGIGTIGHGIRNTAASTITSITNSGLISGTGATGGYSQGISNGSGAQITSITNTASGVIRGILGTGSTDTYGILNDFLGTIGTITNAGAILASGATNADSAAISNDGTITTITNTGSMTGIAYGIRNNASRTITTIINDVGGMISGGTKDIINSGTITTLNNAQADLSYDGRLPRNYGIILGSNASTFGQLVVSNAAAWNGTTGTTSFGIYGGSVKSSRYAAVISGVSASLLNSSSLSGTYTSGGRAYAYTLALEDGSTTIWDLLFPEYYAGPSIANTNQSLVNTASVLQGTYTLQNSVLANSFSYDCTVFGANNVCVSAGGRNTAVAATNGLNNTSALLIAAYRLNQNYRIGAYADQNLSVSNPGGTVNLGNNTPLIGLFGAWSERLDGTGAEVKVSAAYGQKNTTITRSVVGTGEGASEAGTGSSKLNSQGAQITAKYGFGIMDNVIVSPYVGVRYTQNNMGGYTEATSSSVTAPLTYSALNTNATTALAGVGASYRVIPTVTAFASAGVETDTNTANGTYSATNSSIGTLTPVNFNANPVRTRPTATLGAYYDIAKNQRFGVTGIYRQEPYQAVSTTTVMATYTIGL